MKFLLPSLLFLTAQAFNASASAENILPLMLSSTKTIAPRIQKKVDQEWKTASEMVVDPEILSPDECALFQKYTLDLLKKIISKSKIESQTKNLFFTMNCSSREKTALNAFLISRTLVLDSGYFGALTTEDALVALLTHELSHHLLKHPEVTMQFKEELEKLKLKYDPEGDEPWPGELLPDHLHQIEKEADLSSIRLLVNAGYSLKGIHELLGILEEPETVRDTHDSPNNRIKIVEESALELGVKDSLTRPFPKNVQQAIRTYFSSSQPDVRVKKKAMRTKVL